MSWHLENVGTPEQVTAAIDEALRNTHGMPASVGAYLKDAIAACVPPTPATVDGSTYLVSVKSMGHRPMNGAGSTESCEVRLIKSGPWNLQP